MPYSEDLDARISELVSGWRTERKKMFGGTCRLIEGNMMCGVHKEYLILRLGEAGAQQALTNPRVKPFDITGRPMKGWVMIPQGGLSNESLRCWLEKAREFAMSLPPK